jgi:hypothetical protein
MVPMAEWLKVALIQSSAAVFDADDVIDVDRSLLAPWHTAHRVLLQEARS